MPSLRVFGSLSLLAGDGSEIRSVTAQPKRIALLAYLAITSRRGPVRRDTVLGLFWPDLDTGRARHALRQALYQLRRELGSDVLEGNGDDQLRVDRSELSCDACEFADALAAGDRERALDLYQGELLPGLFVAGCAEFEQWVESTRSRLSQQALEAAGELGRAAAEQGGKAAAVRWAKRAHELAPFDEPVLRRLLEALEVAGDPATAVLVFEAFAARCERELGVTAAADTVALVSRLRANRTIRRKRRRAPDPAPSATSAATPARAGSRARSIRWVAAAVFALAAAGLFVAAAKSLRPSAGLDPNVLAIPPFRVLAPTADSLVLTEGIAELLAVALQSGPRPRVEDIRVTGQRWRALLATARGAEDPDLASHVAASLGAGMVLHGLAFVRGQELVITARLLDVATGEVRTSRTVHGPADQLVALVDQLATHTLGFLTGEDPVRLQRLMGTDFTAVQAYLNGRAAARRGNYDEAYRLLGRALELDSTFASAALALVDVAGWSGLGGLGQGHYERIAYEHRDRLSPRDTTYLRAWIGYEVLTGRTSSGDLMRATEAAAATLRDMPEVLYLLGDRFYHIGDFLQRPQALRRSLALMQQAVALDSGFSPGREHLIEFAVFLGDSAAVRRNRADLLAREPDALRTPYLRWLAAHYLRDGEELRRMSAAVDTMNRTSLALLVRTAQEAGIGLADAERAVHEMQARAGTADELELARQWTEWLYRNLGRHIAANSAAPVPAVTPETRSGALIRILRLAQTTDFTPPDAAAAAAELARRMTSPAASEAELFQRYTERYAVLCWRLWLGDTTGARDGLAQLRAAPLFSQEVVQAAPISDREARLATVAALLEHATTARSHRGRRPALERLDSLTRFGVSRGHAVISNVLLIRLFDEIGQKERALAAARRRLRGTGNSVAWLAPMLRQEARLAAQTGDRAGALRAYRHYLALRSNPDPDLRPQADSARAEYRQLLRRNR